VFGKWNRTPATAVNVTETVYWGEKKHCNIDAIFIDVIFFIGLTMHCVAMEDISAGLWVFHLPVPLNSLA